MAEVAHLRGARRAAAEAFAEEVTPKGLCEILHAMRRWYSSNTAPMACRLLRHRDALAKVMSLEPPWGAWRGFKVDRSSQLARRRVGERFSLLVTRNGSCSSWSAREKFAHRFSGATKEKVGLVVRLVGGDDVRTFIAPPAATDAWFNDLYAATMGAAFRFNEQEYALHAERVVVELARRKDR